MGYGRPRRYNHDHCWKLGDGGRMDPAAMEILLWTVTTNHQASIHLSPFTFLLLVFEADFTDRVFDIFRCCGRYPATWPLLRKVGIQWWSCFSWMVCRPLFFSGLFHFKFFFHLSSSVSALLFLLLLRSQHGIPPIARLLFRLPSPSCSPTPFRLLIHPTHSI